MNRYAVSKARVVTPDEVIVNGTVYIKKGLIEAIESESANLRKGYQVIDASGRWLIPGLIDLHNDAIEKEIEPRPNALIPLEMALLSLESRLLTHGVTSIYHSLSFMEDDTGIRNPDKVIAHVEGINHLKKHGLIRHNIHARYDVTENNFCSILIDLINKKYIQMVSFMDHRPGQGQYRNIEELTEFMKKYRSIDIETAQKLVEQRMHKGKDVNIMKFVDLLAEKARKNGLPMASHDDDCGSKVEYMYSKGVTISEFPVDLATCRAAAEMGMHVMVGGPNIIRGKSNSGNMRAIDAINENTADIICSDYLPSAMLHAAFRLYYKHSMPIWQAVKMVSLNPARAVGIDGELGSIECGKRADLVMVNEIDQIPVVELVFVNGLKVLAKGGPALMHVDRETRSCLENV